MNLSARIQLIDDMISENPEYTIRDYLDMVAEIEQIKHEDMGSRKGIPNIVQEKRRQIVSMAKSLPVAEICRIMGVTPNVVYKICAKYGDSIRAIRNPEALEPAPPPAAAMPKPAKFVRPPAVYSNHSPFGIAS